MWVLLIWSRRVVLKNPDSARAVTRHDWTCPLETSAFLMSMYSSIACAIASFLNFRAAF
jgi:hypothetical protein